MYCATDVSITKEQKTICFNATEAQQLVTNHSM